MIPARLHVQATVVTDEDLEEMIEFSRRTYGWLMRMCAAVSLFVGVKMLVAIMGIGDAALYHTNTSLSFGDSSAPVYMLPAAGTWALILLGIACIGVGILTLGVRSGKGSRRKQRPVAYSPKKSDSDDHESS